MGKWSTPLLRPLNHAAKTQPSWRDQCTRAVGHPLLVCSSLKPSQLVVLLLLSSPTNEQSIEPKKTQSTPALPGRLLPFGEGPHHPLPTMERDRHGTKQPGSTEGIAFITLNKFAYSAADSPNLVSNVATPVPPVPPKRPQAVLPLPPRSPRSRRRPPSTSGVPSDVSRLRRGGFPRA